MREAFSRLMCDLESADFEVAKVACKDVGLLLERHVSDRYADQEYSGLFSIEGLLEHRLDEKDYDEIIDGLARILDRRGDCADVAAWAAGKAMDSRLRVTLLNALQHYASIGNDDFVYQIMIALQNYGMDDEIKLIRAISSNRSMPRSSALASEMLA